MVTFWCWLTKSTLKNAITMERKRAVANKNGKIAKIYIALVMWTHVEWKVIMKVLFTFITLLCYITFSPHLLHFIR